MIPELTIFQKHFHEHKIVVYKGVKCDSIMFEGQVGSSKRIHLLYDDVTRHYHVIANLTGVMAKRYVCKACNKGCRNDVTHTRVGTLIVATIYLQLIQNRYMFRSFTVLQCSHQHCVQPVASDVEVVGYL